MNKFRVEVRRHESDEFGFSPWEEAVVLIDGRPLMDIVASAERRFDEDRGGDYMYPPPSVVLAPSRHLLGVPSDSEWGKECYDDKTVILGCTCGVVACWMLAVRIDVGDDAVMWSGFENPGEVAEVAGPEAWNWDEVGPFMFDRRQYEIALGFVDPTAPA